ATGSSSLGGAVSYTENGLPVVIDSSVRIFDAELSAADSFDGATLTLARSGGASSQDVFSATGNLAALVGGQGLVLGGVTVGTVVTNAGGTLSLSFNASATQARINEVLSSIAYANSSDAPPASVQLDWAFSDGNSGSQGSGGALAASGSSTVNIAAVNDAPVITFVSGNANYPENAGAVIVAPAATVSDVDSTDFAGGRLVVSFSANGQPEDRIAVRNQGTGAGQIGVSGNNVTYGGVVIGIWSGGTDGATALVVSFNASATAESAQALGRNITYENVSDNPSTLVRTMVCYLEDGDGGTSNTVSGTLTIVPANDAPVVAITPASYAATEQVVLTLSGTGMSVSDADAGTAVLRATLTVASGALSAGAGSTGVTLAGSGSGSLTVDGTVAQINAFLAGSSGASLSYLIDTDAPPTSDTLTLSVDDLGYSGGPARSGADTATINITAVNDGPINHIPGAQVTGVNTALVMSAANGNGLSITDADAGSALMRVALTATSGTLTLGTTAGLASASGNGTASVIVTGTLAAINTALDGLRFTPASGYSGTASFVVETSDQGNTGGGALSDIDTVFVKVGASRYQQGVDGYTGTEDTYVSDGATTTSYGNATTVVTDDGAPVTQGLLRFGNLFGSGVGQIPYGAVINSVALSFYVTNIDANDSVSLYRMFSAWDESSTWDSLGSGVSLNGVEAASSADVANWDAGISGWNTITSGLTATVQAWANGATNNGWVFNTPSVAAEKWTFASSEYATVSQRPYLVVSYTPPAPPVITSNGGGDTASVNVAENGTYVTTVTATDADSAQSALSYAIAGGADADKFSITASGVLSFKVAPDYEAPGDIGANRVYDLTVRVSDGYVADTQDITVTVTAVNEAPALGGLGGSVSHTEGGAAAVLAGTATVSDPELSAANSFDGATLTLARSGGANAEDIFSATGRLATLTAGQNLVLDGAVVGTVSANGGGTLGLSFNASATQARIDEVLRSIAYANSADAPPASVQIRWTFSDGNTGSQGTGSALTAVGITTVNITAVNDPAVIGGADTASLTETNAAQSTGGTLTISDVDGAASFVAQSSVAGSNGYGSFSIASNGVWSYTMGSAHDEFDAGLTYTDTFTVAAADGTTHLITVSITGTNDVASLSSGSASLTETDAVQNTGGTLSLTDADTTDATVVAQADTAGTYGRFSI
ncbi:MAG: VCBS domain-containing protein, partial [Zoogloea sp.]|nr:VCBS domain-containing protein [Zoogloea sp.]